MRCETYVKELRRANPVSNLVVIEKKQNVPNQRLSKTSKWTGYEMLNYLINT